MSGMRCSPGTRTRNERSGHEAAALPRTEGDAPFPELPAQQPEHKRCGQVGFVRRKSYPGHGRDGKHRGQEILQIVMTFIKSLSSLGWI